MIPDGAIGRRQFLTAAGVASIGLLAGCSGDNGTTTGGTGSDGERPVRIGSIQPFSGNFAVWGRVHASGLAFAVDEINGDGGVLGGRELRVVEADSGSDPAEAASAFERFAEQDNIVAATGPVSSDVGIRTSRTA